MMNKKSKKKDDLLFYIGIFAMLILIFAVSFLNLGSIQQKLLFLFAGFLLFTVATLSNQRVLQALEIVTLIGVIVAFMTVSALYALSITLFVAMIMVTYLYKIEHYRKEPIGMFGSFGFVLLALGYAFNNGSNPLIASAALGFGSLAIAVYSCAAFILYKNRIQLIFIVLNAVFSISPLIILAHILSI